jgi:uncharacterized membrane protein
MINKRLYKMILTGIFAALCFVSLFVKIPIPSPVGEQMIHLGNLIVILVAFLFGGLVGGLAGSIGMGLYDIFYYPDSTPSTLVLKLGIGLVAAFVFGKLNKNKEINVRKYLISAGSIFMFFGVLSLSLAISTRGLQPVMGKETFVSNNSIDLNDASLSPIIMVKSLGTDNSSSDYSDVISINKSEKDGLTTYSIKSVYVRNVKGDESSLGGPSNFTLDSQTGILSWENVDNSTGYLIYHSNTLLKIHWSLYVFSLLIAVILIVAGIFITKLDKLRQFVLLASSAAVFFNIVGGFISKTIRELILGFNINVAIIRSIVSLPATIINASLCVILAVLIFPYLHKAVVKEDIE